MPNTSSNPGIVPRTPTATRTGDITAPLSNATSSDRGRLRTINPAITGVPQPADVNSRFRSGDGENRRGILPPLPPSPLPGRSGRDYFDRLHRHYDDHADHWFGGARSWRHFIHGAALAPWFWTSYPYMYRYPWAYGYYNPGLYLQFGYSTPSWYGQVYYPWWDWCDAPFVYYYYRYPARFSFNAGIAGADYGVTYTDYASADVNVDLAFDRPLGVWVPGHYEQDEYGDWLWVDGYYTY